MMLFRMCCRLDGQARRTAVERFHFCSKGLMYVHWYICAQLQTRSRLLAGNTASIVIVGRHLQGRALFGVMIDPKLRVLFGDMRHLEELPQRSGYSPWCYPYPNRPSALGLGGQHAAVFMFR
jgi:hypothetical protein